MDVDYTLRKYVLYLINESVEYKMVGLGLVNEKN